MKKCLIFCISILFLFLTAFPALLPVQVGAAYNSILESLEPYSEIILFESLEDGTVLFDKGADVRTHPASLTKLVTAIVALENCPDIEKVIVAPEHTIKMFTGTNSSTAGIKAGEEITIFNLLRCMLIPSANEAAAILADYVGGGSIEKFVGMMNAFVRAIGCEDTHFLNPHGLDAEGQYTTASDMAKIARYALSFKYADVFEQITSTKKFTLPKSNMSNPREFATTNFLMNSGYKDYYSKYVTGIKTGSTTGAGRCVIAKAVSGGYSYLAVIMKGTFYDVDKDGYDENGAFLDAKELFEWTFKNIRFETILTASQVVAEVGVNLSSKDDRVQLVPEQSLQAFVPKGVGENSVLVKVDERTLPESVDAPVKKGQKLAEAVVYYAGEEIARTSLVADKDVGRSAFLHAVSVVRHLAAKTVFKIITVIAALLIAAYIGLNIYIAQKKKKRRRELRVLRYRDIDKR